MMTNLSVLERHQLEAIVLGDSQDDAILPLDQDLRCSEIAIADYLPPATTRRGHQLRHVLAAAHELLTRIVTEEVRGRSLIDRPQMLKEYMSLFFAGAQRESFVVVYLDAAHFITGCEEMFSGTLTQTSVYPREVVRRALELGAAAVAFGHNHPSSGHAEPSRADEFLTQTLKSALTFVDVRVIDHIVVGAGTTVSFAERGLL